ncbi:MAG: DJ-1/PfpI family protein [Thalassobaculum sp.]|uniref:DJ-1/PfpI family protein n=1 Tax=Thalassobaculum sp. TaxID=2022740 RepID=UPI0032EDC2A7
MADKPLAGRVIAVMLANGFDEIEFTEPQKKLIEAGATTKVVSRANGLVNGWYEGSWGHFFPVDVDLAETLAVDFDGLVVPGGFRAVEKLSEEPHSKRVLKAFMRASMPVAVIGDAGKLLAVVEAAKGRTLTSSEEAKADLETAGASWEAGPVVVEGSLVTANGVEGVREAMDRFIEVVAAYERETDAQAA